MKRFRARAGMAAVAALGLLFGGSLSTAASGSTGAESRGGESTFSLFQLDPLNESGARGIGIVRLSGNEAKVRVVAFGLLPGSPHAQHFHIQGAGQCPTEADDTNGDGIVSTVEGQPDYGSIGTSLTTTGDTSPASGLAVSRFPTAEHGIVKYNRTIHVSDATADDLRDGNAVIVLHGIDANGTGKYDGDAKSELDPALPLEATAPAACGSSSLVVGTGFGLGFDRGMSFGF